MRYVKSFFVFWQDFLIGDCPEVAVGTLAVLGIALGLHSTGVLVAAFTASSLGMIAYLKRSKAAQVAEEVARDAVR